MSTLPSRFIVQPKDIPSSALERPRRITNRACVVLLNDGSCNFAHPVVKGLRAGGTLSGM